MTKYKYIRLRADQWSQCYNCFGYFLNEQLCNRGRCPSCHETVCIEEDIRDYYVIKEEQAPEALQKINDRLKEAGAKPGEIFYIIRLSGCYSYRYARAKLTKKVDMRARKEIARVLRALADCYETLDLPIPRIVSKRKKRKCLSQ